MESLDMKRAVICIFLMALVTYVPGYCPLQFSENRSGPDIYGRSWIIRPMRYWGP